MLRGLTLPDSWRVLLGVFRPVFGRSSTFMLFLVLATGLVGQSARRTVVGMLAGAGMAAVVSFHAVCRFFSHHVWDADRLGLLLARLIVTRLLDADTPILLAIDDTLFRRWGRKVHHAVWTRDGAAQGPRKLGRGNRWVIAAIVIELPFCSHPVCLPVLCRLWAGKGRASPVQLAAELLTLLAEEFNDRVVHGVADAAYHGRPLVVAGTTWTTRLPANAALYGPKPPPTGKRGRPRHKGHRLGRLSDLAATATWQTVTVSRYARRDTVQIAVIDSIWYGAFGNTPGHTILVRDTGHTDGYDVAIFTTDPHRPPAEIVARYAARWPIETAIAAGKQLLGIGQARNRLQRAVERTVPFEFVIYSLIIIWYANHGYHPDDITARLTAQPWYDHKTEPAFEDMLIKLRRTLIAARISGAGAAQPDPHKYHDYTLACAATAA
jgi:DDE superfamily endonuclease